MHHLITLVYGSTLSGGVDLKADCRLSPDRTRNSTVTDIHKQVHGNTTVDDNTKNSLVI